MNMKRFICLALAAVLALGVFAGCSSEGEAADSAADAAFDYSAALNEKGFFTEVNAGDVVKLGDYKNIQIPAEKSVASEEDIQLQIDYLLTSFTTTEENTERAIADGDTVNIDYVGKVDGVEFESGSTQGKGTVVTIGVTQYIDDFLEQLIGHKPGETFDIEVTFPEDYGKEELNGKDAVFTITVNFVVDTIVPEFDDAFVLENFSADYGYESVAQLKKDIAESIVLQQEFDYILTALLEQTTFDEMPQQVMDHCKGVFMANYESTAASYGVDVDTLLAAYGISGRDELLASVANDLQENAQLMLCAQAIAEVEGIEVTEDDVKSVMRADDLTELEALYGMNYMNQQAMQQKAFMLAMDNATRAA